MKSFAGLAVLSMLVTHVHGQAPRVPFSGVYGGTAGAGSILGWDRTGGGDNPAILGDPGWTASLAGYAPFGLDGLRVTEGVVAWDRARWGLTASYLGMFSRSEKESVEETRGDSRAMTTAIRLMSAWRPQPTWTTGVAAGYRRESGTPSVDAGLGLLWRPKSWGSLGSFLNLEESPWGTATRAGVGVDGGSHVSGLQWRACAEAFYVRDETRAWWETRYAAALRLHPQLSLYAGWDPPRESASIGVRFGFGDWEGFSAMRRHRSLGGTSLQGIRWHHAKV